MLFLITFTSYLSVFSLQQYQFVAYNNLTMKIGVFLIDKVNNE